MAITVQQVLSYLDTHPLCTDERDVPTLLHTLCRIYSEYNPVDPPEIKSAFDHLDSILCKLPLSDNNQLFDTVIRLCIEYENAAFAHGIAVGLRLMAELYTTTG